MENNKEEVSSDTPQPNASEGQNLLAEASNNRPTNLSLGAAATGAVGAVVGAVVGGVVGGLTGKSAAEAINPTVEDAYWREHYTSRPYVKQGRTYEDYESAYRLGYEGYVRHRKSGRTYKEIEAELRRGYESKYQDAGLTWEEAKYATRDAWDRADRNTLTYREAHYWRNHYTEQPYYSSDLTYEDYQPAFRVGYEGYTRYHSTGRTFDEVELELQRDYERDTDRAGLAWETAKLAARDAWYRVEQIFRHRAKAT